MHDDTGGGVQRYIAKMGELVSDGIRALMRVDCIEGDLTDEMLKRDGETAQTSKVSKKLE